MASLGLQQMSWLNLFGGGGQIPGLAIPDKDGALLVEHEGSKQDLDQREGVIIHEIWILYSPSAPSWLVYKPSLQSKRRRKKTKYSLMHYFILLAIPRLLFAETIIACSAGKQRAYK